MTWRTDHESTVTTLNEPPPEDEVPAPPPAATTGIAPSHKVAIAAVLVLLVSGLVWQLSSRGGGEPGATPTSIPTASTAAPSSLPLDPSAPPQLNNTGEDFDAIVRSAGRFADWVYQFDPDPKWVPSYMDPDNTDEYGFSREEKNLADLKAAGHHYDSPATTIRKVIVRDRGSNDHVTVYVVYEFRPASIVDRDGKVVTTQPSLPLSGHLEDWVRREDGRWRQAHSVVLGPPAPEVLK
ncbi:MAG: hypothetical protein ACRDZW_02065 [Acidimicrobiales bacterium]